MDSSPQRPAPIGLGARPAVQQWAVLLFLSALLAAGLELARLPAALLIGPMLAAIATGVAGATIRVPARMHGPAQGVIGCLMAASVTTEFFTILLGNWPVFVLAVLLTLAASSLLGYAISRWKVLPGTTGIWGSAPGGATAMVLMAEAFGGDARLVAFMQYLRVIMVSVGAAVVAGLWIDTTGQPVEPRIWFPALDPVGLGAVLLIVAVSGPIGMLLRIPLPYFLGSLLLGAALHVFLDVPLHLPQWLLAAVFTLIGWSVGLSFTLLTLKHAARALPQVVGSILLLMAFCGGVGLFLSQMLGVDPLTAYLATSPGGLDSIAIVAAASDTVDLAFVMTLQTLRLIIVIAFGPPLAQFLARRLRD